VLLVLRILAFGLKFTGVIPEAFPIYSKSITMFADNFINKQTT